MLVDRLVQHQPALVETEHGPTPVVVPVLDGKAQLAAVEFHGGRQVPDREHWDQAGHFHGKSVELFL
jgi:hypothetical protein